jgi:hypothetical protein
VTREHSCTFYPLTALLVPEQEEDSTAGSNKSDYSFAPRAARGRVAMGAGVTTEAAAPLWAGARAVGLVTRVVTGSGAGVASRGRFRAASWSVEDSWRRRGLRRPDSVWLLGLLRSVSSRGWGLWRSDASRRPGLRRPDSWRLWGLRRLDSRWPESRWLVGGSTGRPRRLEPDGSLWRSNQKNGREGRRPIDCCRCEAPSGARMCCWGDDGGREAQPARK